MLEKRVCGCFCVHYMVSRTVGAPLPENPAMPCAKTFAMRFILSAQGKGLVCLAPKKMIGKLTCVFSSAHSKIPPFFFLKKKGPATRVASCVTWTLGTEVQASDGPYSTLAKMHPTEVGTELSNSTLINLPNSERSPAPTREINSQCDTNAEPKARTRVGGLPAGRANHRATGSFAGIVGDSPEGPLKTGGILLKTCKK
jgi:hypothetical protein